MRSVKSRKELRDLMIYLSNNMSCNDEVEIHIAGLSYELLTEIPKYAMANDLSIIDIKDVSDGYVVLVKKRFGKGCR